MALYRANDAARKRVVAYYRAVTRERNDLKEPLKTTAVLALLRRIYNEKFDDKFAFPTLREQPATMLALLEQADYPAIEELDVMAFEMAGSDAYWIKMLRLLDWMISCELDFECHVT